MKLGHSIGKRPLAIKQLRGLGPIFVDVGDFHSAAIVEAGNRDEVFR